MAFEIIKAIVFLYLIALLIAFIMDIARIPRLNREFKEMEKKIQKIKEESEKLKNEERIRQAKLKLMREDFDTFYEEFKKNRNKNEDNKDTE